MRPIKKPMRMPKTKKFTGNMKMDKARAGGKIKKIKY